MDAVAVVRSSTDGTWEYSPRALWPDAADLYAFYAYSPANSRNVDPAVTFKGNLDHKLKYTVPTEAGAQEDFLVAIQERAANGAGPVSLNFKHALSRVLVNARAAASLDGFEVTVKKVTFKNLVSSGTLVLAKEQPASTGNPARTISTGWPMDASGLTYASYTEAEVSDVSFAPAYLSHTTGYENFWQQGTGRDSYPVDIRTGGVRISGGGDGYSPLTGELGALMVMPQRTQCSVPATPNTGTTNDFYVEIEYSFNGGDHTACKAVGDYWTRGFNASGDGFVFEPGKAYEFNIVIGDGQGPRFVGLDVNEVAGWETNPGIEVPRPPFANKQAGSNVYFVKTVNASGDNITDAEEGYLTFDESYGGKEGYQGLFFKWGSLVGVAAGGNGAYSNTNTYLYIPDISNGKYYKVKSGQIAGVSGTTTAIGAAVTAYKNKVTGNNGDWDNIPYDNGPYIDARGRSKSSLTDNSNATSYGNYKGDICKFLSEDANKANSKLTKRWVLPISNDFGDAYHDLPYTGADYAWSFVSTSITPSSADGGAAILSYLTYTIVATGETVKYPASGYRDYTDGQMYGVGDNGSYWSSSPEGMSSTMMSYCLDFSSSVSPANIGDCPYGQSVRCVRESDPRLDPKPGL